MHDPIVSSRYELHVSELGAAETKAARSYYDVYPTDTEADKGGDDPVGYVHSIEVGSTVDGPGIRLVLFLTGCPLRCQYCHNPDTWHKDNGTPYTLSELMTKIGKYTEVLKISKGGITISGGEPVVQRDFATKIFNRCKALGLHTCLDTSGRLGHRLSDAQLNDIDLQLLDIKSGSEDTYRLVTGHPLQPTLDYARRLSDLDRPIWVRFVLVPGLTDAYDNVEQVADICTGLRSLQRVEILRFHQMGLAKYHELGIPYPLEHAEPPSNELTERVREQFRKRGLSVF